MESTLAAATIRPHLLKRSLLPAPIHASAFSTCRCNNAILNRLTFTSGANISNFITRPRPLLSVSRSSQSNQRDPVVGAVTVTPLNDLTAASTHVLRNNNNAPSSFPTPISRNQRRPLVPPRAYKEELFKFQYPVITERPEWFWRTLACLPYLLALQISDTGYFIQPFIERYEIFENLIYYVPGAIGRLPTWFPMIYCYFGYILIVKNKEWPHYFRFHLMMGMLLETALQILWHTSNFMPLIHYTGRFGMYYWAGVGLAYVCVLAECVRCALGGKYANVPFVSDAAYVHTLFNIGGYHRF